MTASEPVGFFKRRRTRNLAQMEMVAEDELSSFIGKNAVKFLPTWNRMLEQATGRRSFIWSWCWPAFLFAPAWFMYRKMYVEESLFLFLPILMFLFTPIGDGGGAAYGAVLGTLGKSVYLQHAAAKVRKIKEKAENSNEALESMALAGGVSVAGGVIGGLIFFGGLTLIISPIVVPSLGG